jgi:hypothetical protein
VQRPPWLLVAPVRGTSFQATVLPAMTMPWKLTNPSFALKAVPSCHSPFLRLCLQSRECRPTHTWFSPIPKLFAILPQPLLDHLRMTVTSSCVLFKATPHKEAGTLAPQMRVVFRDSYGKHHRMGLRYPLHLNPARRHPLRISRLVPSASRSTVLSKLSSFPSISSRCILNVMGFQRSDSRALLGTWPRNIGMMPRFLLISTTLWKISTIPICWSSRLRGPTYFCVHGIRTSSALMVLNNLAVLRLRSPP